MRWPDGTFVPEDPRAVARRLDAETPGWCVWRGHATGAFWAVTEPPSAPLLVEARTAGDLIARMRWANAARGAQRT